MVNKNCKKLFSFYPCIIAGLVLLSCLSVWPLRLLGHTVYKSASLERAIFPNLNMSDASVLTGQFMPAHRRLDSISFRFLISGQAREGSVTLNLTDSMGQELCSVTLESGDIMNYRWVSFPTDLELDPQKTYIWHLQADAYEETPLAMYSGSAVIGPKEAGAFYYNGAPQDTVTPAVIYTYTDKTDNAHCLPYYTVILLFGLLAFAVCRKFEKANEQSEQL